MISSPRPRGWTTTRAHKASFYMKQIANAVSPSNFIHTNPELFRETVASKR